MILSGVSSTEVVVRMYECKQGPSKADKVLRDSYSSPTVIEDIQDGGQSTKGEQQLI